MKIGIFQGSSTGNTANAAKALKSELDSVGDVDLSVRHRKISFLVLCWGMTDCCCDYSGHMAETDFSVITHN